MEKCNFHYLQVRLVRQMLRTLDTGGAGAKYVHVRVQQRNGRKSLTTVQGLKKDYSYNKILKDLKKEFCCNGTVVQDPDLGQLHFFHSSSSSPFTPYSWHDILCMCKGRSTSRSIVSEKTQFHVWFLYKAGVNSSSPNDLNWSRVCQSH